MRPRAEIGRLKAHITVLEAQVRAAGLEPLAAPPEWSEGMAPQEAALMVALVACYPRVLDRFQIDEAIPHHDHAADRDDRLAQVVVCRLRKRLGRNCIETIAGVGYRAHPEFMEKVAAGAAPA